ncbi:MAG TPA: hypothetical protein VM050_06415 [Patescibacteria group bacterium]|nr:hypothetical protein [Patescibacteria group bacterium]
MENRRIITFIAVGLVAGLVLGAVGGYMIALRQNISSFQMSINMLNGTLMSLSEELADREEEIEALNFSLASKDVELAAKDEDLAYAYVAIEMLNESQVKDEEFIEVQAGLVAMLNYSLAYEKYRSALMESIISGYVPDYEPTVNFYAVYDHMSFDNWWAINGPKN